MPKTPTAITPVQNRTEITRRGRRSRGSRTLLDCVVSGLPIAALVIRLIPGAVTQTTTPDRVRLEWRRDYRSLVSLSPRNRAAARAIAPSRPVPR